MMDAEVVLRVAVLHAACSTGYAVCIGLYAVHVQCNHTKGQGTVAQHAQQPKAGMQKPRQHSFCGDHSGRRSPEQVPPRMLLHIPVTKPEQAHPVRVSCEGSHHVAGGLQHAQHLLIVPQQAGADARLRMQRLRKPITELCARSLLPSKRNTICSLGRHRQLFGNSANCPVMAWSSLVHTKKAYLNPAALHRATTASHHVRAGNEHSPSLTGSADQAFDTGSPGYAHCKNLASGCFIITTLFPPFYILPPGWGSSTLTCSPRIKP